MDIFEKGRINPTAIISGKAVLGNNVTVGPYSIIYDYVNIGSNSIIGPQCIIGEPIASYYSDYSYQNASLEIGENALLRSGTIVYAGSKVGDYFETGHRVTVRENTHIGHHTRVGNYSDIMGHCNIGDYVRIHSSVHIGPLSKIGDFVWIYPFSVLTNDPHPPSERMIGVTIDEFAVIGAHSVLLPGIRVETNSVVGAGSVVYRDVIAGAVVAGNPARKFADISQIRDDITGNLLYPWPEHFDRGMPWKDIGFKAWELLRRGKKT